eukprot:11258102-Alexandrium_andersonii.AAC.1
MSLEVPERQLLVAYWEDELPWHRHLLLMHVDWGVEDLGDAGRGGGLGGSGQHAGPGPGARRGLPGRLRAAGHLRRLRPLAGCGLGEAARGGPRAG